MDRTRAHAFFPIEFEDLISIGESALLEAWVSYRDLDPSRPETNGGLFGGKFSRWARQVVLWRVSNFVAHYCREGPPVSERRDSNNGVLKYRAAPAPSPETTRYEEELRLWLRTSLGRLSPRQRSIAVMVAQGETKTEIALSLGLSRSTVHLEYQEAIAKLRRFAEQDDIEGLSLVEEGQ